MMDGPFLRALVAAVEKNLFPLAQISRASTQSTRLSNTYSGSPGITRYFSNTLVISSLAACNSSSDALFRFPYSLSLSFSSVECEA
ncbi:hypothetical protein ACHAWO_012406 [Cyclotella atomus]|uniref:Uncharacterized protein n=1 Tax=Cyclotella atomus TaxID=382360 RepID=A0ABD3MZQ0_9STRA